MPGRPIVYKTTHNFLRTFGLQSLSDLPAIEKVDFGEPVLVDEEQLTITEPAAEETK